MRTLTRSFINKDVSPESLLAQLQAMDEGKHNVQSTISKMENIDFGDMKARVAGEDIYFTDKAVEQMTRSLKIPYSYFKDSSPELRQKEWAEAVEKVPGARRTLIFRLKGDTCYAVLQPAYNTQVTNFTLARVILNNLPEGFKLSQASTSDYGVHMFLYDTNVSCIPNDTHYPGCKITLSEAGHNPITFETGIFRLVCSNGLVVKEGAGFKMSMARYNEEQLISYVQTLPDKISKETVKYIEIFNEFNKIPLPEQAIEDDETINETIDTAFGMVIPSKGLHKDHKLPMLQIYQANDNFTLNGMCNAATELARDLTEDSKLQIELSVGNLISKVLKAKQKADSETTFEFTLQQIKKALNPQAK